MIIYILGIGSTTHPISPNSWYAWERDWKEYQRFQIFGFEFRRCLFINIHTRGLIFEICANIVRRLLIIIKIP